MSAPQTPQVSVYSFGYLHDTKVFTWNPQFVVDLRRLFRDPHRDPAFRELTGHHAAVRARVLGQPGARAFAASLAATVTAVLPTDDTNAVPVMVALGCAGGRHRSVVLADTVATHLATQGVRVHIQHLHINRPVVAR
ncbi:RNase adapter RapZ [Amycolatopsis sp. NPDC048633]|uniref:RapZ C-terminal domain-containing protein n=1 Tax=Amycolatopsis sp. NPDC048633 TaxID=3157095 RepID=UPI0033EEDAAC